MHPDISPTHSLTSAAHAAQVAALLAAQAQEQKERDRDESEASLNASLVGSGTVHCSSLRNMVYRSFLHSSKTHNKTKILLQLL